MPTTTDCFFPSKSSICCFLDFQHICHLASIQFIHRDSSLLVYLSIYLSNVFTNPFGSVVPSTPWQPGRSIVSAASCLLPMGARAGKSHFAVVWSGVISRLLSLFSPCPTIGVCSEKKGSLLQPGWLLRICWHLPSYITCCSFQPFHFPQSAPLPWFFLSLSVLSSSLFFTRYCQ